MGHFQETSDAYAQAVHKLHTLQNRSPFPSVENLEKSQLLKGQYAEELGALRAQLESMQMPDQLRTSSRKDFKTTSGRRST